MKNNVGHLGAILLSLLFILAAAAAVVGWVMNLVKLFLVADTAGATELVIRLAGVIIPVVGAIFGFM